MATASQHKWRFLALHFQQKYERGYRYLDSCGEFMVRAEKELGFISGEAQPKGAKLDHPSTGVHLEVDTLGFTMSQELPDDVGGRFCEQVIQVSRLVEELFAPETIFYNGFLAKRIREFPTEDQAFAATLKLTEDGGCSLGDVLGLTPFHQALKYAFKAGSFEYQVDCKPIAFTSVVRGRKRNYGFGASERDRRIVDEWNEYQSSLETPDAYALSLEADLRERNPPVDRDLRMQFERLLVYLSQTEQQLIGR